MADTQTENHTLLDLLTLIEDAVNLDNKAEALELIKQASAHGGLSPEINSALDSPRHDLSRALAVINVTLKSEKPAVHELQEVIGVIGELCDGALQGLDSVALEREAAEVGHGP